MARPTVASANSGGDNFASVAVAVTAATGDTLIIVHFNDYYTLAALPTPTVTAGVGTLTSLGTVDEGTNGGHIKTYSAPVTSGGSKTVTFARATDEETAGVVLVVANYDNVDAVLSGGFDNVTPFGVIAPSVSPTTPDALLVCGMMFRTTTSLNTTWTAPGGMTERADRLVDTFLSVTVATQELSASGATGTKTFVASNATGVLASAWFSIALKGLQAAAGLDSQIISTHQAVQRASYF